MSTKTTDDPQITELEDLAWSIKDDIATFHTRALPGTDRAALAAIGRDLTRIKARINAVLHKRKRDKEGEPAQANGAAAQGEQQPLLEGGGVDG